MEVVYVQGHPNPLALEEDGKLDLAPLQLQPASIVLQGTAGLVGPNGITKRTWTFLRQGLPQSPHPAALGTRENPLQVDGKPVAGSSAGPAGTPAGRLAQRYAGDAVEQSGPGPGQPAGAVGPVEAAATLTCAEPERQALNRLGELCARLQLDKLHPDLPAEHPSQAPAFDGPSLLLLTAQKLELFLQRYRPQAPAGTAEQYLAQIRQAATPLWLAYDEQPGSSRAARPAHPVVPDKLYSVERTAEHAVLLDKLISWEAKKEARDGNLMARANIVTCGYFSGVGKSTAAERAANPAGDDLTALASLVPAEAAHAKSLCRALACLRITVNMSTLQAQGTLNCDASTTALAWACWKAVQREVKAQLNIHLQPSGTFLSVEGLLDALQAVLGSRCQLLLHLDEMQSVGAHGKPGQWFATQAEDFRAKANARSPPDPGQPPQPGRTRVIEEMGGTYGVWTLLTPIILRPGVFAFLTGKSVVPYLLGRNYLDAGTSPGDTFAHLLPPLTPAGVMRTTAATICDSGQSILVALSFDQAVVDEVLGCERTMRWLQAAGDRSMPTMMRTPTANKAQQPAAAGGRPAKRKRAANQHPGPAKRRAADAGVSKDEGAAYGSGQEEAAPATPLAAGADAAQGAAAAQQLSAAAQLLIHLILCIHWITCGVPLLVRLVCQEMIRKAVLFAWASMTCADIDQHFCNPHSDISAVVAENERGVKAINLSDLTTAEKQQLILEAILGRPTTVMRSRDMQQAVLKAAIYTRPAPGQDCSVFSPIKHQPSDLQVIPLLPPPVIYKLSKHQSGTLFLADALQREPDLVESGRALELMLRSGLGAKLVETARRPKCLAEALPLVEQWEPAKTAIVSGARMAFAAIPGTAVKEQATLSSPPTSKELEALDTHPWDLQLALSEARYQMVVLKEAPIGWPHSTSAGPDLFFQVGEGEDRVLIVWQCKVRIGKANLGVPALVEEAHRTATLEREWRKKKTFAQGGVLLVYLVVGDGTTKELQGLSGQVLPASKRVGRHKELLKVDVLVPTQKQAADLLGAEAMEALISLRRNPCGTRPTAIEQLAMLLTSGEDQHAA